MAFCNCDSGLSNMGVPNCQTIQSVTKKLIYVPTFGSNGTRNGIAISDVLDQAYVDGKIQAANPADRWYPTPYIENVEDTKGDSTFESLNNGSNIFIQEGARTFTGVHIKQSTTFLGKLKSGRCVNFGVYMVDIDGTLTGSISSDGQTLYPIAVDKETFNPVLVKATDTTVQKIQVSFEFDRIERDENLKSISAGDISASLLTTNGLISSNLEATSFTATGGTLTVTMDYGTFGKGIKVEGLELADISVFNVTTSTAVTVATVTEGSAGVYTLAYASGVTTADELRISLDLTSGYEATPVTATVA